MNQKAHARLNLGDYTGALDLLNQAVSINPDDGLTHTNICFVAYRLNDYVKALESGKIAVRLLPEYAPALVNLATVLIELRELNEAQQVLQKAISISQDSSEAWDGLSLVAKLQGQYNAAIHAAQKATVLAPQQASKWVNFALLYQEIGEPEKAHQLLLKAKHLDNKNQIVGQNLLMNLQYLHSIGTNEGLKTAKEVSSQIFSSSSTTQHTAIGKQTINIGFVSADFRKHPVGYFLLGMLKVLSNLGVNVFLYLNQNSEDELTEELKSTSYRHLNILQIPDLQLKQQIQSDGIDILVDLSGHSRGNRLGVFATRAAPKQVSWLGYFATTGLNNIDAVFIGNTQYVVGLETAYSEKLHKLDCPQFTYTPPAYSPEVTPSPCIKNGYITFGSFNNLAKLNSRVVDSWAEILSKVKNSILVLKWNSLSDGEICNHIINRFTIRGIDRQRIVCRGASPHQQMLVEYKDIDIALDPYPFNGGLTTCEALWMGVPVISLFQLRPVSRQSLGILKSIGLSSLTAATKDQYVNKAVSLSNKTEQLNHYRLTMRNRMKSSPLFDYELMANAFYSTCSALISSASCHKDKQA